MRLMDIVEDLLIEFEHLENMLEILEIGFENFTNGDHKCETSSIYIIDKYLEMIKTEYIEKLTETLSNVQRAENKRHPKSKGVVYFAHFQSVIIHFPYKYKLCVAEMSVATNKRIGSYKITCQPLSCLLRHIVLHEMPYKYNSYFTTLIFAVPSHPNMMRSASCGV